MLSGDSEIEHSSTSTGVRERGLTGLDAVTRSGGDRPERVAAALVSLLPNTHGSPGRLGGLLRHRRERLADVPVFFISEEYNMAREFSREFYNSAAWKACRESYKHAKGGLCEDCLKHGIITAGAEVHHVIELTPENVNDPNIALNWDNLCLLCKDCHAKRHTKRRYRVDKTTGAVILV